MQMKTKENEGKGIRNIVATRTARVNLTITRKSNKKLVFTFVLA